ncbi:hypothetical protein [Desulfobulbus sp.]|uniref:hypothetical protein n=1 Tax=Desulfobulbus sp. TaxID=895 RepID=UPI0027B95055|nr:hypothetical protein [Desulfobulbus sp.]
MIDSWISGVKIGLIILFALKKMAQSIHFFEKIETPIGSLSFSARAEEDDLSNCNVTIRRLEPGIPKGMNVEKCMTILLHCLPTKALNNFTFPCVWDNLQAVNQRNSGEALDAWGWESNGILVMIGTEDSDCLNSRLNPNNEYSTVNYSVRMINNIIIIQIDNFEEDKVLSLHYVIAWNSLPELSDCSCWYAVDVPHEKILRLHNY